MFPEKPPPAGPRLCASGSLTLLALALTASSAQAQHSYNGSTGYINTPSAHMREDGTLVTGLSHASPYTALYVAMQALPWLEISGRYQQTAGVAGFAAGPGIDYGSYKDKSAGAKLRLWPQGAFGLPGLPAVAVGIDDVGIGTQVFATAYAVSSKTLHWGDATLDASLGYGQRRMQGVFGGLRYTNNRWPSWSLVADYDRIAFRNDIGARQIGLDQRPIGQVNLGLEYTSPAGWAVQFGRRDGQPAVNVSLLVPFGRTSLQSKTQEPAPYTAFTEPLPAAQWPQASDNLRTIVAQLHEDGYRDVTLAYEQGTLRTRLGNNRFLDPHRAAGRALRILLAHGPQEQQRIELTLLQEGVPTLQYVATDLPTLARYFSGGATAQALLPGLELRHADPHETPPPSVVAGLLDALRAEDHPSTNTPDSLSTGLALDHHIGGETPSGHSWRLGPAVHVFFNDPSGAFKAAVDLRAEGRYQLQPQLSIDATASYRLLENISDVSQASNSLLPHVRSDVAEYFRHGRLKLDKLVLNHLSRPTTNWYARASAGLYEPMFAGLGGQLMYVPERAPWTLDFSLDYLAQRDFAAPLKLRDYRILSGFASAHAELPHQLTGTVRWGRFLAGDTGARFELKREFPSGVQMGFWFSATNGRDTTSPGTVAQPYQDKGVFLRIPFDAVAHRHTRRVLQLELAPWTRDVGQMVRSPADLRQLFEHGVLRPLQSPASLRGFGGVDALEQP
jgi:hypothetical protein